MKSLAHSLIRWLTSLYGHAFTSDEVRRAELFSKILKEG